MILILKKVLPFARHLLESAVVAGDVVVDATIGNGHDTLFLSNLVGSDGRVIGFDVQEDAIKATTERIQNSNFKNNVRLFHESHEHAGIRLEPYHGKVSAAIFNLGYLPGSDKSITTKGESTIASIKGIFEHLKIEGIIVLVIYHGHEAGKLEKEEIMNWITSLPQETAHVLQYQFLNQKNDPPYIIAIEKR